MIRFPLLQKMHEFELGYGRYNVYVTGGFGIENIESLDVHLTDTQTGETITLKEKAYIGGDIIEGERAVLCFSFDVYSYSKYKLTIANPEIIVIKRNYDASFFTFSRWSNIVKSNTAISLNTISVIIK